MRAAFFYAGLLGVVLFGAAKGRRQGEGRVQEKICERGFGLYKKMITIP